MVAGSGIVRAARQGRRKTCNQKGAIHRLSKENAGPPQAFMSASRGPRAKRQVLGRSKGNITTQARRESTRKAFRTAAGHAMHRRAARPYPAFALSELLCTHGCNRKRRLPWMLNRSRVSSGSAWACSCC
jgi:hypothetical protein